MFDNAHSNAILVDGTGNQSITIARSAFYRSYNASTIAVNAGGVNLRGNIIVGTTREGAPWGVTDRHVPASIDYNGDDLARVSVWQRGMPCLLCGWTWVLDDGMGSGVWGAVACVHRLTNTGKRGCGGGPRRLSPAWALLRL